MPRAQFSIRTLLWLTLVAAVFLGGIQVGICVEQDRRMRKDQIIYEAAKRRMGRLTPALPHRLREAAVHNAKEFLKANPYVGENE